MLSSLTLGNRTFSNNIIQGPLAGVSTMPFRMLSHRYSAPAFNCTEMISCKTILHQPKSATRYLQKSFEEGPVCFQLSGNNPVEVAQATKIVTDLGADLIDLNCGCPVKKIRQKGAGSSLLMNPILLYELIRAMKNNTTQPVSIKIRVEGTTDEKFHAELVRVVHEAGADFLVVHGRHWLQHYETPCNYEHIKFFAAEMKIPVIGNGDIACLESLQKMLATGCQGAMIGRAGVGQPWLIKNLMAGLSSENSFYHPSAYEIAATYLEHITRLVPLLGGEKFALLHARKLAKYYARSFPFNNEFCKAVNDAMSLAALHKICEHFVGSPV